MKPIKALFALAIMAGTAQPILAQNDPLAGGDTAPAPAGTLIIGSADFPESQLLATIYELALKDAGVPVQTRLNIGSREVYLPALLDGSIGLIPEYAGAALSYLDRSSDAHAPAEVIPALKAALPEGVTLLEASDAQNADSLVVTEKTATDDNLKSISDLKDHAGSMVLGGPPEWQTRHEGVVGLKEVYGLEFKSVRSLDAGGPLTLSALLNGQIQAANLFSTDPALVKNGLVTLEDDKNLFRAQNIVPVIATSAVTDEITGKLNAISAALTTEDLTEMNARLAAHESYETVATDFLKEKGLD